jgi:hypothetical protein
MPARLNDDLARTCTEQRSGADLAILEFDQWTNTNEPAFSPTTICWRETAAEQVQ